MIIGSIQGYRLDHRGPAIALKKYFWEIWWRVGSE
jgi:hypothetical protein